MNNIRVIHVVEIHRAINTTWISENLKFNKMKISIIYLVALALTIGSCKKESKNNLNPTTQPTESLKTIQPNFIHPYFIKYKNYRNDLNSTYKNFIDQTYNKGC